jgi:hypothetical protein
MDNELGVLDGVVEYGLPDWAATLIWLGAWCRSYTVPGKRLITFVVLPTRDLAAAFACLGSLIEGSRLFQDTLSWARFRALPQGSVVFWKQRVGTKAYSGTILGFESLYGSDEFIRIQVSKPAAAAKAGLIQSISERYFDDYLFSIEQPPSASRSDVYRKTEGFFRQLLGNVNTKWIWADGAEALLVSNLSRFELTLTSVSMVIGKKSSVSLGDLLCLGRNPAQSHSKIRLSHPRGSIAGTYPLAILDGPEAFYVHEHLDSSTNILVIADRSEYRVDIDDAVMQLRNLSASRLDELHSSIPDIFPAGVEIAAFAIDAS